MLENPLQEVEKTIKDLNNIARKHSYPVLRRYPLLFALLVTLGASAILEGFRLFIEKIVIFKNYPFLLIVASENNMKTAVFILSERRRNKGTAARIVRALLIPTIYRGLPRGALF